MLLNLFALRCCIYFQQVIGTPGKGHIGTNIALHKPAKQSSTLVEIKTPIGSAEKAVDGGVNNWYWGNSCTHTSLEEQSTPWWEVDLQINYRIRSIRILNRDRHVHRLHDIKIDLYDNIKDPRIEKHCITHPGTAGPGWLNLTCETQLTGRYVRISKPKKDRRDPLTLCEVEIYGAPEVMQPLIDKTPSVQEKDFIGRSYLNCCSICN